MNADTVRQDLALAPDALSCPPAGYFSVDFALCHPPALHRFARELSRDDPFVECLKTSAKQWPYSSLPSRLGPRLYGPHQSCTAPLDRLVATLRDIARAERRDDSGLSPEFPKALKEDQG